MRSRCPVYSTLLSLEEQYIINFDYFSEEAYGQSSVQAAAAWYEYGNALLLKEEENPANGVLGNVEANPNGAVPEDDDVGEEEEDHDDGAEAADGEEGEDEKMYEEDEPEGDLQVAWEALDVSLTTAFLSASS